MSSNRCYGVQKQYTWIYCCVSHHLELTVIFIGFKSFILVIYGTYTKILEVNLFAFAYRLFHRDFSPINVDWGEISMKQSVGKCKQINF